jgi:hypothetical protein
MLSGVTTAATPLPIPSWHFENRPIERNETGQTRIHWRRIGCHTFRVTGITVYLEAGGTLENAQAMAAHESPRTTKLYDRTGDEITLDEVERIANLSNHSSPVSDEQPSPPTLFGS